MTVATIRVDLPRLHVAGSDARLEALRDASAISGWPNTRPTPIGKSAASSRRAIVLCAVQCGTAHCGPSWLRSLNDRSDTRRD
jgi:hypothetical protein